MNQIAISEIEFRCFLKKENREFKDVSTTELHNRLKIMLKVIEELPNFIEIVSKKNDYESAMIASDIIDRIKDNYATKCRILNKEIHKRLMAPKRDYQSFFISNTVKN